MANKYYVIFQFDRDATVRVFTPDDLQEFLAESGYGFIMDDDIRNSGDPAMWGDDHVLIIKGEAITPEAEEKVTRYGL